MFIPEVNISDDDIKKLTLLMRYHDIDISSFEINHLKRRLRKRMIRTESQNYQDYFKYLISDQEEQKRLREIMAVRTKRIMEAELDDLFEVKSAQGLVPRKARILESVICQECGEVTMESRTRRFLGQTLCIPCFEANEKRY